MSNKSSNFPSAQLPDMSPGEMASAISEQLELANWERIDITQSERIGERIEEYFRWCIQKDHKPHVEEMALALGTTRQTLWNWQQQGGQRGEIISLAKQLLASLHESWGLNGKLNPATFCFIAKNHYGYRDDIGIDVSAMNGNNQIPDQTAADIAARHRIGQEDRPELPNDLNTMLDELPE